MGRPSGLGMKTSSSLGSGVGVGIGSVGFGSATGKYRHRAEVKLRVDIRFMIVRWGVLVLRWKYADDASTIVRRNGTAILGCSMLWCGVGKWEAHFLKVAGSRCRMSCTMLGRKWLKSIYSHVLSRHRLPLTHALLPRRSHEQLTRALLAKAAFAPSPPTQY
jgi:hypothetical protein